MTYEQKAEKELLFTELDTIYIVGPIPEDVNSDEFDEDLFYVFLGEQGAAYDFANIHTQYVFVASREQNAEEMRPIKLPQLWRVADMENDMVSALQAISQKKSQWAIKDTSDNSIALFDEYADAVGSIQNYATPIELFYLPNPFFNVDRVSTTIVSANQIDLLNMIRILHERIKVLETA